MNSFMVIWARAHGDMEERGEGMSTVERYRFTCVCILKLNDYWEIIATLTISRITVNIMSYCASGTYTISFS